MTKSLYITMNDMPISGVVGSVDAHYSVGSDIETVIGGQGDDKIVGTDAANVLMGNARLGHAVWNWRRRHCSRGEWSRYAEWRRRRRFSRRLGRRE